MVGSVLSLEMLLGSRRGKQHVFRWIYAGWLGVQVFTVGFINTRGDDPPFGDYFLGVLVVQHFLMIALATPAMVAGAITDEKSRGTLQYLLTADLTSSEIVLGKLLGRLAQVGVLLLTALPVFCFCGVFGGMNLPMLGALVWLSVNNMLAIGAAVVLASVWCRNTRDAVISVYAIYGVDLVVGRVLPWIATSATPVLGPMVDLYNVVHVLLNPLALLGLAQMGDYHTLGIRLVMSTVLQWAFAGSCTLVAVWRLRTAYLHQLEGAGKKNKLHWWRARRLEVSADPIRWKERQVEGLAPLALLRGIPTYQGVVAIVLLTITTSTTILWHHLPSDVTFGQLYGKLAERDLPGLAALLNTIDDASQAFRAQAIYVMFVASLIVGIRCSGAVSGEREQQTWEALLLTPLETRQLIRGKLWGIIGASYPYLRAYAIPAVALSILGGPLALFWTLVWLVVTWLAMYYVGAAGIWCSVRSKSSWRSLLGTLGFCYVGAFVIYGPLLIAVYIVALVIMIGLLIVDALLNSQTAGGFGRTVSYWWEAFFAAVCIVLAAAFWLMAWLFLNWAERDVSARERMRHWDRDPDAKPRRRKTSKSRYYR